MKKQWKRYLESLDSPLEFFRADEFRSKYNAEKVELSAIFKAENGDLMQVVNAASDQGFSIGERSETLHSGENHKLNAAAI